MYTVDAMHEKTKKKKKQKKQNETKPTEEELNPKRFEKDDFIDDLMGCIKGRAW